MRILHVSPSYYPAFRFGGPIRSVHLLNKALIEKGVTVDVLTTDAGLDRGNCRLNEWESLGGLRVFRARSYGYENYTFSPGLFLKLFDLVKGYDIVHITSAWNFPALAAALVCGVRGKPYIISPRGALCPPAARMGAAWVKRAYWALIARWYFNRADRVHFTTRQECDTSRGAYRLAAKSVVVPNIVDFNEFQSFPPKEDFLEANLRLMGHKYLLFLGRITPVKGLDILAEAFSGVAKKREDISLVISGPDDEGYAREVRALLQGLGCLDRVIFTGMLSGRDKLAALAGAEALVLPSYSENFGMAAVEAMACGVPVAVSDGVGIADEIIRNDAGIVFERNPEKLLEALLKVLENEDLRRKLAGNASKWVRVAYARGPVSDIMISVYREMLNESGKN